MKTDFNVLLVGYNGANNTGAEARLLAVIDDVRSLLGPRARITVPTLNEKNLRRYLAEDDRLRIAPIPTLFFRSIARLVRQSDLVMLVEGSTYMDTWGSPLLYAFLWATNRAHRYQKPCLAYAVDAGELSPLNRRLVKRQADKTDLIITRTIQARERLEKLGVTAPLTTTADCALIFSPQPQDRGILATLFPQSPTRSVSKNGVVGLAVVDFSLWPVVMRPWGRARNCYKWPYFFSCSPERKKQRNALVRGWTRIADRIIKECGRNIALICSEALDQPLAEDIRLALTNPDSCRVVSSNHYNASQMTSLLCDLDLLVTSRYHSAVLSLRAAVPQVAIGHDFRLKSLYQDLGLYPDYFIQHDAPNVWQKVDHKIKSLLKNSDRQRDLLKNGCAEQVRLAQLNRTLLSEFLQQKGIQTQPMEYHGSQPR
ncbi:polysaccharide pyruvyl transferase family protein [candidate division KSB1 bacterium]|nr:polysaccharide pyruvyl transferase family protein [candidate division KSB1 bacterium]